MRSRIAAAMAAGVEVRFRFLTTILSLSRTESHHRESNPAARESWILKQAMWRYLPEDVIHRPKTGFGAPLRHWLHHELKDLIADVLSPGVLQCRGIFDPVSVRRVIQDDRAGRIDGAYTILAIASVELWCRYFIDQRRQVSNLEHEPVTVACSLEPTPLA